MKALLLAAMPVVLMDGHAPDLDQWSRIEPAIAAAVVPSNLADARAG